MLSAPNRLKWIVAAIFLACCGSAVADEEGTVFSLSQKREVLNKIGTFKVTGNVGRLFLSGSTQFLEIDMSRPLSRQNNVSVFRYSCTEMHGQMNNPRIWQVVSIGELTLDGNTLGNGGMDGSIRQTHVIQNHPDSSEAIPQTAPIMLVRFAE
jgi:hypothetical protein